MRIVLVSSNFRPHVGGIERFTEILAGGLAAQGHDVKVVCCRDHNAVLHEDLDGFAIERIRSSYLLHRRLSVPYPIPTPLGLIQTLRRAIARADVVHVQDVLYATSAPALILSRRLGVPSVLTQHVAFVPQATLVLDAVERAALTTLGRCARLADVVATLNPAVAEWVAQQWKVTDVRILPIGIPARAPAEATRDELRRSFNLPPDRFLALFVGRDVPKKGLDVFLSAARTPYDLVAVTDGRRHEDTAKAHMLPFMSPGRLQSLLRCVDAFVLPSEGEGLPISLQEALAAGLPIVTTRQPGYDGFLSEDDALFVERNPTSVSAAIELLAGDAALCRELGARSVAVAQRHFAADRMIGAYEALYREICTRVGAADLTQW